MADWVGRAVTGRMVISQAIGATRNGSCPTCEGLVIEPDVRD